MGITNFGSQIHTFDYNQDAVAKKFNAINYKLLPTGIYSGFVLTKLSNSYIQISAGTCSINDETAGVSVRIETSVEESISVSSLTPYIILRFEWADVQNNYMDMLAVAFLDILPTDIIVGRCVFDSAGTTLSETFDYTRRSVQYLNRIELEKDYLKVLPTEPISNQFILTPGIINSSKGNLIISGGTFPVGGLENTVNGRIDLVYIDENGALQIVKGTDSSTPVATRYGNRKVIAEIRRGSGRSDIKGTDIFRVVSSYDSAAITSDQLIVDSGSLYSSSNVEDALQEIAGSAFTFKGIKTFNNLVNFFQGIVVKGIAGSNIQEWRKTDDTLVQRVDQNGKLFNTVGTDLKIADTYNKYTTDKVDEALNQIAGLSMTIDGVKTFSSSPIVPTPTTDMQTSTKKYVDDNASTLSSSISTVSGNLSTHASAKATDSLGHVITGGDISVDSSTGQMTLKNTGTANTYTKVTTDAQGRVTSGTTLSANDIPDLNASKIATGTLIVDRGGTGVTSSTGTGSVVLSNSPSLSNPVVTTQSVGDNSTKAASTEFVQKEIDLLTSKKFVNCCSTVNESFSDFENNVATYSSTGLKSIDGVSLTLNTRVLLTSQSSSPFTNGVYYVSRAGTSTVTCQLTRTSDGNTITKLASCLITVNAGTNNSGKTFICKNKTTDTLNATSIVFEQLVRYGKDSTDSANKLVTARDIALTGDATGSASFDGSSNVSITTTLADSGVTASTYPKVTVDSKGRVIAGYSLSASDIPVLDAAKITSGTLTVAQGGTGTATATGTGSVVRNTNPYLENATTNTQASTDNSTKIATTAFVKNNLQQITGIQLRTSDPPSPAVGTIWLRTDL